MFALLDGDIITYRCGFAAQHTHYKWDGEVFESWSDFKAFADMNELTKEEIEEGLERELIVEPVANALSNVRSVVTTILDEMQSNKYKVFLSTGNNYRGEVSTIKKYKANREGAPKPEHYDAIHQYLLEHYDTVKLESIEADDAMALCQTKSSVICSLDKDMLQVPGFHYNWVRDEKIIIRPEIGTRKLFMQVLTGDPTDNIPGIYGIGQVRARKLLADVHPACMYNLCVAQWREYFTKQPEGFNYHEPSDMVEYVDWRGGTTCATVPEIVDEVLELLTVGGPTAYAALQKGGERIPLPSEEEREKAWATRSLPFVAGGRRSRSTERCEGAVRVRDGEGDVRGTGDGETVHAGPDPEEAT